MSDPSEFYAEQCRRNEIADQEWAERQDSWRVGVDTSTLAAWSEQLVPPKLRDVPLTRATSSRWRAATGLGTSDYLGHVLTALAASAVAGGALVVAEPGEVHIAFAYRDPETESETGLGWGFRPAAARHLRIVARRGLPIDDTAGGEDVRGAAAARRAMELAAETLADAKQGPSGT